MSSLWEDDGVLSQALQSSEILEISHRKICSLWAGYGSIVAIKVRYLPQNELKDLSNFIEPDSDADEVRGGKQFLMGTGEISRMSEIACERVTSLVCKSISPPFSGKGISHERKVRSYVNEATFYRLYAESARIEGGINLAEVYYLTSDKTSGTSSFLLSDLREVYPIPGGGELMNLEVRAAVDWLAQFHAFFWEKEYIWNQRCGAAIDDIEPLWEEGCYWYLDTRMAEHESISNEWSRIKNAAFAIADSLKDCNLKKSNEDSEKLSGEEDGASCGQHSTHRFKTLVHGDCKAANMMFRANDERAGRKTADTARIFFSFPSADDNEDEHGLIAPMQCAMYDFQYTGGGYGPRDLAKLMISSVGLRRDSLEDGKDTEQALLAYYHRCLCHYMEMYKDRFTPMTLKIFYREYTLEQVKKHYELSLLDFVRFMQGWGLWGNTVYAEARSLELLNAIDGGKCLTVEEYHQLFREHYCN